MELDVFFGVLCDFHFLYVAFSAPQESFNFNKYLSEKRQKYPSLIGEKGYPLPPTLLSQRRESLGLRLGSSTCIRKGCGTCLAGITSLTHTRYQINPAFQKKIKKPYTLFGISVSRKQKGSQRIKEGPERTCIVIRQGYI